MIDLARLFPGALSGPIPLSVICPDAIGSKSQQINPDVPANQPHVTLQKLSFLRETIKTANGRREPTKREVMMIGSFPLVYQFAGNGREYWSRIGNSVPPMLMRAVALQIKSVLWGGEPLTPYPKSMSYLETLEAAWQDHLAPRADDAPTVISTFDGGGGSSLGYSMAGYRELLAVEWDDNAVATFKANFPDVPVYHGDIGKLSVDECLRLAGIEPGELDVFDGSPPCQGFSTAGKRIMDDPRNQLFREYVRLLRGLRPKVFVMENVSGMVKGKMKLIFADILRELKASGYRVSARLLNAKYFYVPQSRERMIFIGVRDDLGIEPSHPKAESGGITVARALEGVEGRNDLTPDQTKWWGLISTGQSAGDVHPEGHWYNFVKLDPDDVCGTIPKASGNAKMCYWDRPSALSIAGYKRIGSFPDSFTTSDIYGPAKERIGNSVPPLMMRSIAAHIRREILDKLPDPRLL